MFWPEFMEKCPAQAAQEKPQLLIFLRPKDISGVYKSLLKNGSHSVLPFSIE